VRKYISVDGGMADNIRPALYMAKYEAAIANRMIDTDEEMVTIAGKCCESGDILVKDIEMPRAAENDILAIFSTGAYGQSMSSNYNRIPKPAVVLVNNGNSSIISKRETYDEIIQNDLIPERLIYSSAGELEAVNG
jgi:diaminopimelate decarboxylase